ncbi:hypothetical protein Ae201684P_004037 [Aphanomyces euteiches]|uniref:Carbohydrate-binding domain-containing protein n=1 Tax=Aphanomyces euteiches TaxID=100861 RepID=A0A6G0XU81_9STRA|nr:hypothetical protein Ae201684_001603 [Aphanomyces euteiches]KAH9075357.1 hypothetical protein Ae201684P_004037 [Aphanomyces euteiches]KAH9149709.1 hypothetical protein AeRB84_007291 [Aphanomyces euteiches]
MYGSVDEGRGKDRRGSSLRSRVFISITVVGCLSLCFALMIVSMTPEQLDAKDNDAQRLQTQENPQGCFPIPSIDVFECPQRTSIEISQYLVDRRPFPSTTVDLCYSSTSLRVEYSTNNEGSFFVNPLYRHNDNIWEYNVFEAFIALGTHDPVEYFEFEVSPTNQTYSAFILNPHKDFSAPIGHFFVGTDEAEARAFGIEVSTKTDVTTNSWASKAILPFNLFNVVEPKGTQWRMNFMRKITNATLFPAQECGAWNAPNTYNFHVTPCFGLVRLV